MHSAGDASRLAALLEFVGRDRYLFLSTAQQRAWLPEQLEPGNVANHRQALFRAPAAISVEDLERRLQAIVQRHEILRTCFPVLDARPCQVVRESIDLPVRLVDTPLAGRERDEAIQTICVSEARGRFDLARGPLLRAVLLRTATDRSGSAGLPPSRDDIRQDLLFTSHQIVTDAWSMGLLAAELQRLCAESDDRAPAHLTPLSCQVATVCHRERAWLESEQMTAQLAYWRGRLETAPRRLAWPEGMPEPARGASRGARRDFLVPASAVHAMEPLARGEEATLFMGFLAALGATLYRHTRRTDLTVGSTVSHRSQPDMRDLIGYFANVIVLRLDLSQSPTFRTLLRHTRTVALDGYAHQDLPIERLLSEPWVRRHSRLNPLFQVMLTFADAPSSVTGGEGSFILLPIQGDWRTTVDLAFTVARSAEGLAGTL